MNGKKAEFNLMVDFRCNFTFPFFADTRFQSGNFIGFIYADRWWLTPPRY